MPERILTGQDPGNQASIPPGHFLVLQSEEWEAWQLVCAELRLVAIDPNQAEAQNLLAALRWWGEQLAGLRRHQPAEVVARAFDEAAHALAVEK